MVKSSATVRVRDTSGKVSTEAELEAESDADELLQDRIIEAIGDAVEGAIRDHKRAGIRLRNGEMDTSSWFRRIKSGIELQVMRLRSESPELRYDCWQSSACSNAPVGRRPVR